MLRPAGSVVEVGSLVAAACGWRESAARAHDGLDEYHRVVEGASHRQRPARAADLIEASVFDTLIRHSFPRSIGGKSVLTILSGGHGRGSPQGALCWSAPRRPVVPQPGKRRSALHRRMVRQLLHEYTTSRLAPAHAHRNP